MPLNSAQIGVNLRFPQRMREHNEVLSGARWRLQNDYLDRQIVILVAEARAHPSHFNGAEKDLIAWIDQAHEMNQGKRLEISGAPRFYDLPQEVVSLHAKVTSHPNRMLPHASDFDVVIEFKVGASVTQVSYPTCWNEFGEIRIPHCGWKWEPIWVPSISSMLYEMVKQLTYSLQNRNRYGVITGFETPDAA